MEQMYTGTKEDFLTRLGEHPYVGIQNDGNTLILRKGWLQMISLSIIDIEDKILVRFRPKISLIGLMILAITIVISIATCLLYTSPSPRDGLRSRMPSSA